ncbi:MAG: FAD-binding monooxygenase [Leptolyngbya sp. ERB_1_1]
MLSACSNVLIVGGGPTGFATALMLVQRGWTKITVLEQRGSADDYEPDKSFNYLIDGRGQKLTDLLGLTDAVSKLGVPNTEFCITRIQANGKRKTSKLSIIDAKRKIAYWLPRRAFIQLLYETIERHWKDQITVLFNTRCIAIDQVATQGTQTLEVVVQRSDEVERFQPFFLVGCDGIQSIVRHTLDQWNGDRFEVKRFPSPSSGLKYKVLRLPPNFPLDAQNQDHAVSTMAYAIRGKWRDRTRSLSLGLLPIKDETAPRTANIVTYPDHQIWDLKTGEAMLDFLEQTFPQLPIRQIVSIEEVDRFAKSRGGAFPTPQFCPGLYYLLQPEASEQISAGVLLLGDAIHCFPPDIGQGVNAALEDVFVLNETLCQSQDDLAQALPRYETIRARDASAVVRLAQIAAPWQYNQNRLRARLWMIQFLLRLSISRLFPVINPPAFFLLQNHQLSYQEIWNREQRGSQLFKALSIIVFSGLLAGGILIARGF